MAQVPSHKVRVEQILDAAQQTSDTSSTGTPLPQALCAACVDALPITGVGLALMSEGGPAGIVAATDGLAATMEDLQFSLGEGPCIDASNRGRPVLQPELAETGPPRWMAFGPAAVAAGIAAIFALPLQVGRIRLGVLDLYRDVPGVLTDAELTEALAFADAATRVLLHLQDQVPLETGALHPDLAGNPENRPVVHQATGMVAVQAVVTLAEALMLLRAHAFAAERSLGSIARDVVERRLRLGRAAADPQAPPPAPDTL